MLHKSNDMSFTVDTVASNCCSVNGLIHRHFIAGLATEELLSPVLVYFIDLYFDEDAPAFTKLKTSIPEMLKSVSS